MPNDNPSLKALVLEAKDACRVKIDILKIALGDEAPELVTLNEAMNHTFDKFKLEGIWLHPISYDEPKLIERILFIRTLPDGSLEDLQKGVKELLDFLEKVLKEPLNWLTEANTSDWNLKMLDALTRLRGSVTRKRKALAEAGDDPMDTAGFPELDANYNELLDDYRVKLKANEVQANENDIKTVKLLDQLISSSETSAKFIQYLKMLIRFLKEKTEANPS
jgi:hypothetical protein